MHFPPALTPTSHACRYVGHAALYLEAEGFAVDSMRDASMKAFRKTLVRISSQASAATAHSNSHPKALKHPKPLNLNPSF